MDSMDNKVFFLLELFRDAVAVVVVVVATMVDK